MAGYGFNGPAFSENGYQAPAASTTTIRGASAAELDEMYQRPAATTVDTGRMSYEDTIVKTGVSFLLVLAGAAVGWIFPALAIPALIAGFALSLVNIFKKQPSAALVLLYAAAEGVFLGAITGWLETLYPGIAMQAVLATFAVFGVTLALFASGKIRASARATKIFLIAIIGYSVYSLLNLGLMVFGANTSPWGLNSSVEIAGIPLGLILGVVVVLLAAYSLVLDFDMVQRGVRNGAPRIYGWQAAFAITSTMVWLYLEILRMLAISRES